MPTEADGQMNMKDVDPLMDEVTRCKACSYSRYHDVNLRGIWVGEDWFHNELCLKRYEEPA